MIDEKKLINFIDAGKFRNPDELYFSENDVVRLIKNFAELSNELGLNEQPKTDWIPCEERLPSEENEEYLVYKKNGCLMLLNWTKKGWNTYKDYYGKYHTGCEINDVIAWMTKPQPYKKEGAENE